MDDLSLMKVRAYIAEARAASANRHADFLGEYADLMTEMRDHWQSLSQDGSDYPPELLAKIEAFRKKHAP